MKDDGNSMDEIFNNIIYSLVITIVVICFKINKKTVIAILNVKQVG